MDFGDDSWEYETTGVCTSQMSLHGT